MPVERPTFSESWYRVADLCPRLRSTVQVRRQHFRGQAWHVLEDPATNQFSRVNEPAYHFLALLDGRRTVAEVWHSCMTHLGDAAPTQGEVIQLLGQLYVANLLQADLPPDAEGLFDRYRKRVRREVQSYLTNFLFIRIPLFDPDRLLNRWVAVVGRLFTWYGFLAWLALIATGLYFLAGRTAELADQAELLFSARNLANNLLSLYGSLILIKVVHEFGHAFACKKFGRETGTGGEVHALGIMFLIFTPLPYVDASSSWAFRSKLQRAVVGAAGMLVEFALAAVAAIVWAQSGPGLVHDLAWNALFLASVSTFFFNANPLLRYDGYYILSDLIEMPNLWQRSVQFLLYLVRRYAWSVRNLISPAHTPGERIWLAAYGLASLVYRVLICAGILLFLTDRLPELGLILAVGAVLVWVIVPAGRFVHYLATSGEIARTRGRAVLSTLAVLVVVAGPVAWVPAPDHATADSVVRPARYQVIYARTDGFVEECLPSGAAVGADGPALVRCVNPTLLAERAGLEAERCALVVRGRLLERESIAAAQACAEQVAAKDEQLARVREQIADLDIRAPFRGVWLARDADRLKGAFLRQGAEIGAVLSTDDLEVRATAGQSVAGLLIASARPDVELRPRRRPDIQFSGRITQILLAGQQRLPSAALATAAGGSIQTAPDDPSGTRTAEPFFDIRIRPDPGSVQLLPGQRVIARFSMPPKPLLDQWWRSLLLLLQKRFHV